ncbi:MAG: hypothetical protein ABR549_11730 [Mycobacteriales bacterium]
MIRVYLEVDKTWAFACAVDYPGWQRRGRGELGALEELESYRRRYATATGTTPKGELQVIGTVPGTVTTGFGAPDVVGPWDAEALSSKEIKLVSACWETFDRIAGRVSAELQKGPRGGGRDRDEIVAHVQEAERSYGRKIGARVPPRTSWPEQRAAILQRLADPTDDRWPVKYAARRIGWHVLDHAWEMADKDLTQR